MAKKAPEIKPRLFDVGDEVVSTLCPAITGKVMHVTGEGEKTTLRVNAGGREILTGADYWQKVRKERKIIYENEKYAMVEVVKG